MGNKPCGKMVDRQSKDAIIPTFDKKMFSHYFGNKDENGPISASEFIQNRLDFRGKLDEFGYIWAHRLLEDVYIRPNFDVTAIINIFK